MRKVTDRIFSHIIPDIKKWPIYIFYQNKEKYKNELVELIYTNLIEKYGDNLKDEISKCAYLELKRVRMTPWKVDPVDEKKFWTDIRKEILEKDELQETGFCHFLLKRIVNRYIQEIFGDFKIGTFKFARIVLLYMYNRMLNGFIKGNILNFWKKKTLKDKLLLAGYVEEVRNLFNKGIVVFLPTHQSNLDSVLLGYIIDYKLGLPAFSYGAGLNLYNYEIAGYFMDRLGAYKVDRRKKNPIYLSTLLTFSKFTLMKRVNSIFYPGGTRSRSGKIETDLKTGLMSSLLDAQFEKIDKNEDDKIFVVPVIYNYHSVLEAKPLIYSYLKAKGKKKFLTRTKYRDKMIKSLSIMKILYRVIFYKSEFVLSLGKPMDVFANNLDSEGNSIDSTGKKLDISDYFKTEGKLVRDNQRNSIYTKNLAKSIAKSYLKNNVVFSSHLVAYAAYKCFFDKLGFQDVYELMKYMEKDEFIEMKDMRIQIDETLQILLKREKDNKIILSDDLKLPLDDIIMTGIDKLGVFHDVNVLYFDKNEIIKCGDFGLLYYYSNRLSFLD